METYNNLWKPMETDGTNGVQYNCKAFYKRIGPPEMEGGLLLVVHDAPFVDPQNGKGFILVTCFTRVPSQKKKQVTQPFFLCFRFSPTPGCAETLEAFRLESR